MNTFDARPTPCKFCNEPIGWTKNKDGKWYPVEGGLVHPDLKAVGHLVFSKFAFHKCAKATATTKTY